MEYTLEILEQYKPKITPATPSSPKITSPNRLLSIIVVTLKFRRILSTIPKSKAKTSPFIAPEINLAKRIFLKDLYSLDNCHLLFIFKRIFLI